MPSQTQTKYTMRIRCPPPSPTTPNVLQFIKFTYCHHIFPNTAHNGKATKYNPLIQALRAIGWQVNPLITITVGIRGAIYEQPIKELERLKIPKNEVRSIMKQFHQIAIKYLTYLILNKRKLDNNQPLVDPT